jgi:hypothetical protein
MARRPSLSTTSEASEQASGAEDRGRVSSKLLIVVTQHQRFTDAAYKYVKHVFLVYLLWNCLFLQNTTKWSPSSEGSQLADTFLTSDIRYVTEIQHLFSLIIFSSVYITGSANLMRICNYTYKIIRAFLDCFTSNGWSFIGLRRLRLISGLSVINFASITWPFATCKENKLLA